MEIGEDTSGQELSRSIWEKYRQIRVSQVAQWVKNPPAMQKMQFQSLDWEDPLDEGMTTHSSILAWRIP